MTYAASTDPTQAQAAVEWFRKRTPRLAKDFDASAERAHQRAFTVAGVEKLAVLEKVWKALDKAVADGTDFRAFQKAVGKDLFDAWGKADSARLETVFRNNTQSALAAGRYAAQTTPEQLKSRPFWMFSAILDSRTTAKICRPLAGMVLPATDPFWLTGYPPRHHRCRSSVISIRASQADRLAKSTSPDPAADPPAPGWGLAPTLDQPIASKARPALVEALPPPPPPAPPKAEPPKAPPAPEPPPAAEPEGPRTVSPKNYLPALRNAVRKVDEDPEGVRAVVTALLRGRGLVDQNEVQGRPDRGKFILLEKAEADAALGPAHASHDFDGGIRFRASSFRTLKRGAAALKLDTPEAIADAARSLGERETHMLTTLIHEELHGHSPIKVGAYAGHGIGLEEAITESLARATYRRVVGLDRSDRTRHVALPIWDEAAGAFTMPYAQSYDPFIVDLYGAAHDLVGGKPGKLPAAVEAAMHKIRSGGYKPAETPEEHFEHFADALGLKGKGAELMAAFARRQAERPDVIEGATIDAKAMKGATAKKGGDVSAKPKKLRPGEAEPYATKEEFWRDFKSAVEEDRWSDVRLAMRRGLARFGMVSKDVAERAEGANVLTVEPNDSLGGSPALHYYSGRIEVEQKHVDSIKAFLKMVPADGDLSKVPAHFITNRHTHALNLLLHEEIHGHGGIDKEANHGLGLALEEATTEAAAKLAVRNLLGRPRDANMPTRDYLYMPRVDRGNYDPGPGAHAYHVYIAALYRTTRAISTLPQEEFDEYVDKAILAFRSRDTVKKPIFDEESALSEMAKELGLKGKDAKRFIAEYPATIEAMLAPPAPAP